MIKLYGVLTALLLVSLCSASLGALSAPVPLGQLTGALQWRSVGPYRGGVVIAVTGVTQHPNRFYMGSTGGGVWETNNYGQTWDNISDKYFDNSNIGAIAVAPSDPNVIYVGTGNPDVRNTMLTGDGMYKSTDGGKTWTKDGLAATEIISRIVVDPNNPDIVYVAALGHVLASNPQRGIYKSTDGGHTWGKILYVNDQTGAIDIEMDPSNPRTLYVAMWQVSRKPWLLSSGGPGSGIYKSTDAGVTWTNITHAAGLPTGIFGRVGLAVAQSDPSVVYAVVQAKYQDQAGGVFRSSDAGKSWTLVNNKMDLTQRAFYFSQVFVDPKDANTVYFPQVSGTWVSHDGGKSISLIRLPHGDDHSMWINPNNPDLMISGNDGGASISRDGGKTWSSIYNQPTAQIYHVNLDNQFPYWIYGAQQDSGTQIGPSAVRRGVIPPAWESVAGSENSWVVPVPGSPWITLTNGNFSPQYWYNRKTGEQRSVSPWPDYKYGMSSSHFKYRFGWLHHARVFAPGNPNLLLLGANVLLESNDQGTTWKAISPDLTRNDKSKQQRSGGPISADMAGQQIFGTITTIGVSPVNEKTIWTGSDDGLVYVTTDGGEHWNEVRPPSLPTWSTITCVEASHTQAGTAYVAASRFLWDDFHPYVYKTTDYGKHWTEIITGLPGNQYVNSIRQDPDQPSLLFVGTSETVYVSFDAGTEWIPLSLNLPAVRVNDIAIQPEQHAVVLGTFGRSFWTLDNLQFLEQLASSQVSSGTPYLFKPQQTWLVKRTTTNFGGPNPPSGYGGPSVGGANLPAGVAVFFYLPTDYAGQPVKLDFTTTDGKLIQSIALPQESKKQPASASQVGQVDTSARLHPGMNRYLWNMRYPTAVDIKGIFHAGFSAMVPVGPEVVPGTYNVSLTYGGSTVTAPFTIKLDPRLTATQSQLQDQFDLLMKLHVAVNGLDIAVNRALDARAKLQRSLTDKRVLQGHASKVISDLSRDIDNVVNLNIQSSEGAIVIPPRLRAWLTNLANDISLSFMAPTHAQTQVAASFISQANTAIARLKADVNAANAALEH